MPQKKGELQSSGKNNKKKRRGIKETVGRVFGPARKRYEKTEGGGLPTEERDHGQSIFGSGKKRGKCF